MSARNYEKKKRKKRGEGVWGGAPRLVLCAFCSRASVTLKPAHSRINTANINNALRMPAWRFSINSEWRIDFNFVRDLLLRTAVRVFIFFHYYVLLL